MSREILSLGFTTRSKTYWAVQPKSIDKLELTFISLPISQVEGSYYVCRKNGGYRVAD